METLLPHGTPQISCNCDIKYNSTTLHFKVTLPSTSVYMEWGNLIKSIHDPWEHVCSNWEDLRIAVLYTCDWSGITDKDGAEVAFSRRKALELYIQNDLILDSVAQAAHTLAHDYGKTFLEPLRTYVGEYFKLFLNYTTRSGNSTSQADNLRQAQKSAMLFGKKKIEKEEPLWSLPPCNALVHHYLHIFLKLSSGRTYGAMSATPLSWDTIHAWCCMHNITLESYELDIFQEIDKIWLKTQQDYDRTNSTTRDRNRHASG